MIFFSLFNNFNKIDILIIVLVIFIIIFLICLSSSLLKKNKLLKEELKIKEYDEKAKEDKSIAINNNIISDVNNDILNELSEKPYEEDNLTLKEEEDINEILSSIPDKENVEVMPYTKNVLRNLSTSGQTSPVNIGKNAVDLPKVQVTSYVKKDDENYIKKETKKNSTNQDYIKEINEQLSKEITPQTIELTDYEKRQEEEAIISYKELLKVKDKFYNITDEEEIDVFIDELKEFKKDLRKDS